MIDFDMDNLDTPFTFRAVQIFVAAVEAKSVTRSAHRLGISPSSVSQQLAILEAALGTRLIERSARVFRLTRAGELFLDPARQLLDDVAAAKARLVLADQSPPMRLRIASIEELDATVTAPWLLDLQDSYPNMTLTLSSGASHENYDALSTRAVDVMLAVDTVAGVDWVELHPILRDPFIVISTAEPDAELSRLPFVRYTSALQIGRQIEAQLRRTGRQPPSGLEFTTNQALFSMTAELGGWAITTALAFLGTPNAQHRLIPRPVPFAQFSRRLALHSRAGALGGLPVEIASKLRSQIATRLIPRAAQELPFLGDGLQVIRKN